MPDLHFQVQEAVVVPFAATPALALKLCITNEPVNEVVHTIALHCQIQLEVTRRRYSPEEQKRMLDIFGDPERWSRTLRNLLWTHANLVIPGFTGSTVVDLPVPCTFDFNVAATKYFEGLEEGEAPLCLMFSGTVFYAQPDGSLQVSPISWQQEAKFRLPVKIWRAMMEMYYPNTVWLSLRRDVFDRLNQYKMQRGIPTWETLIESLIPSEEVVGK
ncbi:MAG TPA: DUF6084 family protein [Candidatus Sulfotelmatobacter sp.]|nr:DUF6084 family protein [Candidatus Sulfotelmatobacter sp.]